MTTPGGPAASPSLITAPPTPALPALPTGLLWLLALANFTVGMGAFMVIGVLSPIALAFAVDKAHAGGLMTVYAAVYAVCSPLLIASTGRFDRRVMLMVGLCLFGLGALVAMTALQFNQLLVGRAVMALGGGIVSPVAAAVGVALSGAGRQGKALAIVFGGLTMAQVVGVPAGAWLGYAYGWQFGFGVVLALSLVAMLAIALMLPAAIAVPRASLALLGQVLRSGRLMAALAFTTFFLGALYVVFTFMSAILETQYGLGRDGVTVMLVIFGLGAVVGNSAGGWATDRWGSVRSLLVLCALQCVLLPLMTLWVWPLALMAVLTAVWSVCAWGFMVPQQARLASMSAALLPVVFALNASAIYIGASFGSALGGLALKTSGVGSLGPVAVLPMAVAAVTLWLVARWRPGVSALR